MNTIFLLFILIHYSDPTNNDTCKNIQLNTPTDFNIIANVFIHTYQKIISSRQGGACNFTPSCSHYAQESIKKHGIFGIIITFDRLERCNYSAWEYKDKYYEIKQAETKEYKLYDPVK